MAEGEDPQAGRGETVEGATLVLSLASVETVLDGSVEMREKNDAIKECIHSISSLTSTATTDAKDSIHKSS